MAAVVSPAKTLPSWLLLAGLAGLLLANFPYAEAIRNANELPRIMQARALVEEGSWAIDGPSNRGLSPGPDIARSPVDGRLVPNKPPGATIVGAAGYIAAKTQARASSQDLTLRAVTWWTRLVAGVLPTLLLCMYLHRILVVKFDRRVAAAGVAIYVLATPSVAYAHLFYGHQLAACLLWVGCFEVVLMCTGASGPHPSRRSLRAFLGGLAAGASVVVEYSAVFAGPFLALVVIGGWRRRGPFGVAASWAAVGACLPIVGLALYQQAVFGSPFETGYHHVVNAGFAAKHGQGLLGLVVPTWSAFETHILSPASGLLGWAPLTIFAVWGLFRLGVRPTQTEALGAGPRLARVCLAIFLLFVLTTTSLNFTGGWRVGPRYLVAVLPALVVGWCQALSDAVGRGQANLFVYACWCGAAALASYSVAINGLAANLWPHIDLTNVNDPISEVLLPLWKAGYGPYSLAPGVSWPVTLVVLGSLLAVTGLVGRLVPERGRRIAIALGTILGFAAVWSTQARTPHPRGPANLRYIERVWEPVPGKAPDRRSRSRTLPGDNPRTPRDG